MHKLAQLCVRRPVFATMLILSLVVVGIFSYFTLGVDLFPKVDVPTVVVIIANPGASAEEIETEITKRIEDAVNTISRSTRCAPSSSEGQSLVTIQFARQERRRRGAGSPRQGQPDRAEPAGDRQAAGGPEVRSGRRTHPADRGLRPRSLREVTEIADKQIKQRLENAQRRRPDPHRRRRAPRDPRVGGSGPDARLQPHHHRRRQRPARSRTSNCPAAA